MITTALTTFADVLAAQWHGVDTPPTLDVAAITTDTRQVSEGALFVALKGERFDGHDFAEQAKQAGAVALVVSTPLDIDLPQLVVNDTRIALGQLGAWVKAQCQVPTIAITGSCGKTTVKEMLASILSRKGKTLATAGNFNNDIGVPLTLFRLTPDHDYAVIELGANHIGEIAYTTSLVKPDIAMVTNLAAAHLEGFGSLEGVATAKGEIYQGLPQGGIALVNAQSHGGEKWQAVLADKNVIQVTEQAAAPLQLVESELVEAGCYRLVFSDGEQQSTVTLPLPGKHNITNALMAGCAAMQLPGVTLEDVTQGLAAMKNAAGRTEVSEPRAGLRLIDDTYNASVPAMKSAIDVLASYSGERWLILGDMAELGQYSEQMHRDVGEHAAKAGLTQVFTTGTDSRVISECCHGRHFDSKDALIAHVVTMMKTHNPDTILVKGARGMAMEAVVAAIKEAC
ncbi:MULTISPECIES: UDP-N-acetylmuramoyl-tripeptide--D-alanyl-D-alanine ligase [unclassified Salinivibrio]|uniref:UDP-N-acetylmuramoyl-tripeptide--D-alanyl-D- alanine ligase n=1 Tax=unclassified Salinivibrio TaxID=2636825 RepID=UPI0009864B76|nr:MULTISPECIES: UDP-N-acetylmuramoyl-tripeptide--D-alanyl-D-alanine ligase [unclassified Salinivibrio]OOF13030.1 UDP-N-acetylmuramoyl-tripeptide--D-alanyl-D-alanine ligase [Salinivibrio sp. PR919]OOF18538.1 UDP-N-acetylmuramoyl-tripeptide--D-alanyl-D-alanine ligase [Salinivibrio sp. PR932]